MSTKTVMDLNKLDALASAADPHGDVHLVTHYRLSANLGAEEAWRRAATPAAIKPLIELARTSLAPSPKLEDIEQYRVQMAAISTASFGYWKESDGIQPDYDTVPLRDVARLFAKYDHLYKFREQVRVMVAMLKNREWAEDLAATGDAEELQSVITELVGARLTAPTPDAVDAALTDAIAHGTGTFRVNGNGSTERVDLQALNCAAAEIVAFSPPASVRDALYQDYAVPKKDGGAP